MAARRDRPGWRRGQGTGGQAVSLVEDREGAIETFVDLDARLGVAASPGTGEKLHVVGSEGDGIVVAHGAHVLEAEDAVEVALTRPGPIGGCRLGRRLREASIVAGEEAGQEGVRVVLLPDARETQFADQAILEGAADALDAALGLRRGGGDPLDARILQGPPHLRGLQPARQLLFEGRGPFGRLEDAVPVGIDRERQAVGRGDLAQEEEVALGIFPEAKDRAQRGAGRIVDGMEEDVGGPAAFQPVVLAAVHLHEHPGPGEAVPAPAMLRAPAGARAGDALLREDAVNRGAGEDEPFPLGEELAEVLEVHPGVGGPGEMDQTSAGGVSHPAWGGAAPVPMDQGGRAPFTIRRSQALSLPDRASQEGGRVRHRELASLQGIEDHEMLRLSLRQGHHTSRIRLERGGDRITERPQLPGRGLTK